MIFPPLDTPLWLRNGNLETVYAKTLQETAPQYRRELIPDSTGSTVVAYDFIDSPHGNAAPLVVLFHGLEGSSRSHYAVSLMRAVQKRGWNGVVAHFRSCGGVQNTAPVFYHSGDTREAAYILDKLAERFAAVYAVGVSLGGNVLAKYLGEKGSAAVPQAAAAVSAPVDLAAAGARFEHGLTRLLYTRYFLKSLIRKAEAAGYGKAISADCKTLGDFDDRFTAPLHGFNSRHDYYRRSSCKPLLCDITVPTLLLNAQNDPFLPREALPEKTDVSSAVTLLQPRYGGHAGFVSGAGKGHLNWLPQTVLSYFEQVCNQTV